MQFLKARTGLLETERSELTSGLFLKRANYFTALSEKTDFRASASNPINKADAPVELLCFRLIRGSDKTNGQIETDLRLLLSLVRQSAFESLLTTTLAFSFGRVHRWRRRLVATRRYCITRLLLG